MKIDVNFVKNNIPKVVDAITGGKLEAAVREAALVVQRATIVNIGNTFIDTHGSQGLAKIVIEKGRGNTKNHVVMNIGPTVIYGRIQELGGEIRPVKAKWLTFRTRDGSWHRVAKVTIPARPYLAPALKDNMDKIIALAGKNIKTGITKG